MLCPHCNHKNRGKATFCEQCGRELAAPPEQQVVIVREKRRSWGCLWALLGVLATLLILFLLIWLNIVDVPPVNPAANLPAPIVDIWDALERWQEGPGQDEDRDPGVVIDEGTDDEDPGEDLGEDPGEDLPFEYCGMEIESATAHIVSPELVELPVGHIGVDFCFHGDDNIELLDTTLLRVGGCWVGCEFGYSPGPRCCRIYPIADLIGTDSDEIFEFDTRLWLEAYYSPDWAPGMSPDLGSTIYCSTDIGGYYNLCQIFEGWVDIPEADLPVGDDCPEPLDIRERIDFSCAGGQLGVLLASSGSRIHEMDYMVMLGDIAGSCSDWHDEQDYIYCSFPFPSAPHYTTLSIISQEEEACVLHTRDGVWYASAADLGCGGSQQVECRRDMTKSECEANGWTYHSLYSECLCP